MIVPLYKRIDFVEHQLAHFARDPELAAADLLYVLDSPELADNLLDSAHALSDLHGISAAHRRDDPQRRLLGREQRRRLGRAGGRIVLLNSDVMPDRPGWLGKMSAFYDATPDIGALGPKLLYEDDSLQHAGMYFYRDNRGSACGRNHHYFKGMHRSFAAANVARAVPAVTAACMMIDRDLYEQAGGLSHAYVQGGYEDSDLCLRLIELGRENWYMPGAELYHLEAQSYTAERRKPAAAYNMWLHTHDVERPHRGGLQGVRPASAGRQGLGPRRALAMTTQSRTREHAMPPLRDRQRAAAESDADRRRGRGGRDAVAPATGCATWTLPRHRLGDRTPLAAHARCGSRRRDARWSLPVHDHRPDVARSHPDHEWARHAGFSGAVNTLRLRPRFELDVTAELEDGARGPLGTVAGRRAPLRSGYEPRAAPLIVTTLGRTGSTWLIHLLSGHPAVDRLPAVLVRAARGDVLDRHPHEPRPSPPPTRSRSRARCTTRARGGSGRARA